MRTLFYSIRDFERNCLLDANENSVDVMYTGERLGRASAEKARGFDIISIFAGDDASAPVIQRLHEYGVRYITVRATGYDNVDVEKAAEYGIQVANVPAYSPYAIAEHALALMLALNRKLLVAHRQVSQYDFTVNRLVGFDLHGKTVGIIGTGAIGSVLVKILHGLGCRLLAYDIKPNNELVSRYGLTYTSLPALCRESDIISLHTSLNSETRHLVNRDLICQMRHGVMLINTSRGACVNTEDIIYFLKSGHIGYYGADVYEHEQGIFFYDHAITGINDVLLKELISLPNVLVTPHQAFATHEALNNIARTTFHNIQCWEKGLPPGNLVTQQPVAALAVK